MGKQQPKILYHYCGLDSFLSILTKSSIWLSDIGKSNDSKELLWFREKYYDYILRKYESCQDENVKEICELILQIGSADCFNNAPLWLLQSKETAKLAANCFTNMRAYCFCLSELKDSLGQWRGYANDGGGIAIGFNRKYLGSIVGRGLLCPIFNFTLGDISYNPKRLDSTFDMLFNLRSKEDTTLFVAQNLFDIFHISTFFKNSSFKEEKEWRVVYSLNDISATTDQLRFSAFDKVATEEYKKCFDSPKMCFSVKTILLHT